jgi:hypothetical protein
MRRTAARRFGLLSLLILLTAMGSWGDGSVYQAASAFSESHAPRIPIPGPTGSHASVPNSAWVSRNWSGYAVTGSYGQYTSVAGTWTVPTVLAPPLQPNRARQFSSTWVGIDGFSDDTLIQAGTEQDWLRGAPFYQSWWEILPASEQPISTITVSPGDVMNVSITKGSSDWIITVTNTSTGQSFTTSRRYKGALTSAEWIQEAPTVGNHVAALAHDTPVDFLSTSVNGANPDLVSSDSGVMEKNKSGVVLATPSVPNANQNGFAVAYGAVPPPPP